MPKISIKTGTVSKSVGIFIQDSSKTDGSGLSGLVFNTSNLIAYWWQPGITAPAAITLATLSTITSAYSSGGFKEADATNAKGDYRLDIPNACLTGATSVIISISGATNMAPIRLEIELTATDNQDSVRGGMTALPNTSVANNASLITVGTGTGQLNVSGGKAPVTLAATDVTGNIPTDIQTVKTQTVTCAASVTVNTNVGTTQPVNFTGTSSSAYIKVDIIDWASQAVSLDANNIPLVSTNVIRSNTAQGGNVNSIKLDSSASSTNDLYKGELIHIISGTGSGQTRTITNYNGSSKQATVDRSFATAPDNTSKFNIIASDSPALNANLQVVAGTSQINIWSGTAQSGSTSNTIKLDTGASATSSIYIGDLITLPTGTGAGQSRTIIAYNGTTKVATVDRNWAVTPDNTTTFAIYASVTPSTFSDSGVAQAGSSTTITLASTSSATNSLYNGSLVTILSGTGSGQTREVTAYVSHVATVGSAWGTNPDSTSAYAIIPTLGSDVPTVMNANVISFTTGVAVDANVMGVFNTLLTSNAISAQLTSDGLSLITDGTYDMKQLIIMTSEFAGLGLISGLPTSPATLRNRANSANRATVAFDSSNNRTTITVVTPP